MEAFVPPPLPPPVPVEIPEDELLLQPEMPTMPNDSRSTSKAAGRIRRRRKKTPIRPAAKIAAPPRRQGTLLPVGRANAMFFCRDTALEEVQFAEEV